MSTTSRIPAAVDALVTLATAALSTVSVVDGPPLNWAAVQSPVDARSERLWLFVGAGPTGDGVIGEQDFNAAGAVSRDERFSVACTAWADGGDPGVKARRDEAFAIVAAVEQFIRTDPSLGGVVLYCRVGQVSRAMPRQTETGADYTVEFTVDCRAYLD